ncbi:MAG: cupin domain-containing protein [Actinobacteria bacterium]|nr:cupin domain-containing protein [Actinomycetota bacterium]
MRESSGPEPRVLGASGVALEPIVGDGARYTFGQPLLAASDGAGGFDIRVVRIRPGGVSADHSHPWEQANYVLSGTGEVTLGEDRRTIGADDFVYVPPMLRHVFSNTGADDLVLFSTLGPKTT